MDVTKLLALKVNWVDRQSRSVERLLLAVRNCHRKVAGQSVSSLADSGLTFVSRAN